MITVIVPTMWKGKEISKMLPLLNEHELVGEIIIIDNAPENKLEDICSLSKITYVTFGKNIYPIPSWNYAARTAKHEKLLIINDDVMFSISLVDAIYPMIREDVGTITLNPEQVYEPTHDMSLISERDVKHIKFEPCARLFNKAAIVIGIHAKSYTQIPEELLIHFNDYFLFKMCQKNGLPNYTAFNVEARTKMSTTVNNFPAIIKREQRIYPGIFDRYGIKDKTC